ncbi:DUF58 domain-containing protein [Halococcoides cellulosivorans]|uniref:DUF58 domain-containing protein n=1 Tax=Halococcoides cellulosivorans TaxID=1679096 RepID=A0A2R4X423_9EURY|nr:DUF58 domain-containing protein [Halococcoides cellulosivorans]AWB28551.1 hypothetical protein HARCEL1_13105 [Halococcoides cellulosivorans]
MYLRPVGWRIVGAAVALVVAGVVAARPLAVAGAAGIVAIGLVVQVSVVFAGRRARAALDVAFDPDRVRVTAGSTAETTVTVATAAPIGADLSVELVVPAGLTCRPATVAVPAGERQTTVPVTIETREAGTYAIDAARVSLTDRIDTVGLAFTHRVDAAVTVTAADATLAGGEGGHGDDRSEAGDRRGLEPGRIRPYVAGDPVTRIDWKTSARHDDRLVRDPVHRGGRPLTIVFDRRTVPGHETAFRRRREAALAVLGGATGSNDRATVTLVDESGRTTLDSGRDSPETTLQRTRPAERVDWPTDPGRPLADRSLPPAETTFDRAIEPFTHPGPVDDPLSAAVDAATRHGDRSRIAVLTEDADPQAVRRAARIADARGHRTTVLCSPVRGDDRLRDDLDRFDNVECAWIDGEHPRALAGGERR